MPDCDALIDQSHKTGACHQDPPRPLASFEKDDFPLIEWSSTEKASFCFHPRGKWPYGFLLFNPFSPSRSIRWSLFSLISLVRLSHKLQPKNRIFSITSSLRKSENFWRHVADVCFDFFRLLYKYESRKSVASRRSRRGQPAEHRIAVVLPTRHLHPRNPNISAFIDFEEIESVSNENRQNFFVKRLIRIGWLHSHINGSLIE